MLAFDEVPISYACPNGPDSEDAQKPMAPVAYNSENLSTFLGVTKYEDVGQRNPARGGAANMPIDGFGAESEQSMGDHEGFDSDTDEVDERRHLKAYWRADEGKGNTVQDVSD